MGEMADYARLQRMSSGRRAIEVRAMLVVLTLKASLFMLVGSLLLATHYNIAAVCTRVLLWPMIAIGLFLMVTFCFGCNIAKHPHLDCLKILYITGLSMAIPALLAFVIFGYIAVGGIDLSSVQVREYNLTEYRGWLRGRVADLQYWSKISACLHDRHACDAMGQLVRDPETGIFVPKRSWAKDYKLGNGPMPIESGCCKPPSSCAFTYVNGTTWIPTPGAPAAAEINVDCSRWSNEQQTLCFQCDSCRAGLLDETKKGWTISGLITILVLIGLSSTWYGQVKGMEID